jgi:hypothetical protein
MAAVKASKAIKTSQQSGLLLPIQEGRLWKAKVDSLMSVLVRIFFLASGKTQYKQV